MSVNHAPRNRFGSTLPVSVVVLAGSLLHPRRRACSAVTGREWVITPEVGPTPKPPPQRGATYNASPVIEPDALARPPPTAVPTSSASAARQIGRASCRERV